MVRKISLIIPHYQSFDTLMRCLDSVPVADDIQVIVVDDKSPDWDKYKNYLKMKYAHVIFVEMSQNGGAGAARNLGLRMAEGEWLIFADADDFFLPNAFSTIKKSCEKSADIIFFKVDSIDLATGNTSDRHLRNNSLIEAYISNKTEAEDNLRFRCYAPWGKMIRRNVVTLNRILFDEVNYSNDIMFSAKVGYYANRIEILTLPIYCITTSSHSLTRKMTSDAIMCRYKVSVNFHLFLRQIGKEKCQDFILRYFVLAIKYAPSCIIPMLKIGIRNRINFFAGLHRWNQFFYGAKRSFSHF